MLWSPWRYDYITAGSSAKTSGCVFCDILKNSASDEENFILKRAEFNFVILNIYPYTSGHLMVVPYAHLDALDKAEKAATDEMMDLVTSAQTVISKVYTPDGINLGMNLGKAAGAGVASHYHMHLLPRWIGDVNFMTAIGQTRTIPETLTTTFEKLKGKI
ncbi:MAG: HIT domain-containing protein [Pyrinomonadaceae bacterium]|nr:HIT domain-containing protein [Pyrinomonadaceae bacterium]MBP9110445.1 HIT domain-containing protein [Pyrinomonadaceae bacterium]